VVIASSKPKLIRLPRGARFTAVAAGRSLLGKRNGDRLSIPAYFGGKASHKMNDHFPAAICKFHVQAIGAVLW
jgi:hypothetical protein